MSKKFAFGAVIGVVAGVVAGVLTAPKSGKETRADIQSKALELKDKAVDTSEVAKEKATKTAEDLKERGTQAFEDAKHSFKK